MLLKPATPLTILLLIAFVLLLISVISTPIVKSIPLATFENVDYGVFGYCKGDQCTSIHVGYADDNIITTNTSSSEFNIPPSTRKSLSAILIVHPIAAFLTLICLCLAAAAHFHAPSHSPRYLLALLILLLPTLLVSLLAFLVDILLFVPHLKWGGWIVLVATILLVTCGVVTCAMRRTLVSRKARKRRIAENAEMSGENFYNRQNAAAAAGGLSQPESFNVDVKEPVVTGSPPTSDVGPTFTTFRTTTHDSDDDRTPLNARNTPSDAALHTGAYANMRGDVIAYDAPPDHIESAPPSVQGPGPRMRPGPPDARLRNQYSDGSMGSRRGPPPPASAPRGRGGYGPRGGYGRGGYYGPGPRGPPPGGPMRGGHPGAMGRGYRGPPQPGGYGPSPGPRPTPPPETEYDYRGPAPSAGVHRQPSPGPIGMAVSADYEAAGQAIEMQPQPKRLGSADPVPHGVTSDSQPHAVSTDGYPEPISPTSLYSRTPSHNHPRAGWAQADAPAHHTPSPAHGYGSTRQHARSPSTDYFEDVDPRFVNPNESAVANPPRLPPALTPGAIGERKPTDESAEAPHSPTTSEVSHFTSISQRPINPRWRPPPVPAQQKHDVLLENNPDFDLQAGAGRGGLAGVGSRMPPLSIPRDASRYPLP